MLISDLSKAFLKLDYRILLSICIMGQIVKEKEGTTYKERTLSQSLGVDNEV